VNVPVPTVSVTPVFGNALNFSNTISNYLKAPRSVAEDFTIEFWMKTTQTGPSGSQWYNGTGLVDAEVGGVTNDFGTTLNGSKVSFGVGNPDITIKSTSNVNTGNWVHVAATRRKSTGQMILYINGVQEATANAGTQDLTVPSYITLGTLQAFYNGYYNGSLDEVRIWNTVRTQSEISSNMPTTVPNNSTGLVARYSFDQGIAGGNNTSITQVVNNQGNSTYNATMYNFTSNGNTSNFINGRDAYTLTNNFNNTDNASGTYPIGTTTVVWNATDGDGQTATCSQSVSVTDNVAPVAIAKNVSLQLDANGNASLTVNDVNNGSYDNCSLASLTLSKTTFSCSDISNTPNFALDFDGSDDRVVSFSSTAYPQGSSARTVEMWIKTTQTSAAAMHSYGNFSSRQRSALYLVSGRLYFVGEFNDVWGGTQLVNDGNWHHVAYTINGQNIKFYIDGQLSHSTTLPYTPLTTGNAWAFSNTSSINYTREPYFGQMDEVRVWASERNATEINNNYNKPLAGNEPNLVAYYPLDEGAGNIVNDLTSNNNDGTLTNMNASNDWVTGAPAFNNANRVVLTATDASGNIGVAYSLVTIEDNTAPTVLTKNPVVYLNTNGTASITTNNVDNGSSDNCEIQSLTVSPNTFDCDDISNGNDGVLKSRLSVDNAFVLYISTDNNTAGTQVLTGDNFGVKYTNNTNLTQGQDYWIHVKAIDLGLIEMFIGDFTLTGSFKFDNGLQTLGTNTTNWKVSKTGFGQNEANPIYAGYQGTPPWYTSGYSYGAYHIWDSVWNTSGNDTVYFSTKITATSTSNLVTLTATDASGNSSSKTARVIVKDNLPPTVITKNITVQLDANSQASITANDVNNGSTDNCAIATMTVSPSTFNCSNVGNNQVTLTVTDNSGNVSSSTANVTVQDATAPNAISQNITIALDANGFANITANNINFGSTDNCGISSITVAPTTFDCSNIGANTVTLTVTDHSGNTSTANAVVNVIDNIPPTGIAHNFTVLLDANGNASVSSNDINLNSFDNCSIASMSVEPNSFTCNNIGTNNVVLTLTDGSGNTSTTSAIVTVEDASVPTVLTQNLTVELDENGTASISVADVDNGSFDNCGIETMSVSPNTFDCDNVSIGSGGVLTSRLSVDNGFELYISTDNNTAGTQVLTGDNWGVKYTNQTNLTEGQDYWIHVKAIDVGFIEMFIGDFTLTGSFQFDNGAQTLGTNTTNWKVSKTGFGQNEATPIYAGYQGTSPWNVSGFSYGAYHIWDNVWDTQGNDIVYFSTKITATSTSNVVTLTATDASGNTASNTAKVIVKDNIAPTAIAQNITVALDANGNASITANDVNNESYDNCGITSLSVNPSTFNCSNLGTNNVVLTATDASGNSSTANAVVTVIDNTAPNAIAQNITVALDANGTASITANDVNNGSFDNCSVASLSVEPNTFNCTNTGTNEVTLTVTDNSGNTSTVIAVVTVVDNTAPTAICQNFVVELDENGSGSITVDNINNGSFDNCGIQSIELSNYEFNCSNVGANTVTMTVTDNSGNVNTCNANVNVFDSVEPAPLVQNITVYLDNNGLAFITPIDIDNGSFDNCGISSLSLDITEFDCSNLGENNVVLTVTDVNGNTSSLIAVVTVVDNIAPSISVVVTPTTLWPPNHKMQIINAEVIANDNCGSQVYLKSITSSEPDNGLGDGDTPNDIQNAEVGTADFRFDLRKERSGKNKAGRTYTIVYTAVDVSGNETTATAYVYVPHSLGKIGNYEDAITSFNGAELEVYPNPTADNVNINFLSEIKGDIDLRLMNLTGAELMSFSKNSVNAYDNVLNLTDYPAGTYLLEVKFNYEIKVIKIIKY
jgi:hypothetical protein